MSNKEETIRTVAALLLSLLLHLLIAVMLFWVSKRVVMTPPPDSSKKISLDLKQFTPLSTPPTPPSVSPPPVPMTTPAKSREKPKEKPPVKTPPKRIEKKHTQLQKKGLSHHTKPENNTTKAVKQRIVKQKPKRNPKKRPHRSRLANALLGAGTSVYPRQHTVRHNERIIRKLYGREFDSFTPVQKKFIRNHLGEIHRITQNTLTRNGYPDIAVRTRQEGTNIVTFYLHPNGDISGLRLKRPIGYTALDQNTLEVIRIAYMHYPHPKTKTKITFYVNYRLH